MALLILDSVRGTIGLIMPAGRALGTDWLLRSGPRCVRCIRAGSATFRGSMIADKRVSAQAKGSCMEAGTQDALEHASRFTSSATNAAEALTELWTLIGASRTVDHDANANTTTYVVKFASGFEVPLVNLELQCVTMPQIPLNRRTALESQQA